MPLLHTVRALRGLNPSNADLTFSQSKLSKKGPNDPSENEHGIETSFPTKQLAYLALCRIAEPIALTSVFPYSYDMMKHMGEPISSNAAFYSGIFIAVFPFAETLTAFMWGSLSDRIGRKPVLLIGCTGTLISLLLMGFSSNIWIAVIGRLIGGLLNGNVAVVQTIVNDLIVDPKHEARAYAIMPFFFTIGCTIGPTIGGSFSRPAETWPGTFGNIKLFIDFPYLLPNLVCAAFLLATIILSVFLLQESHPRIIHARKQARQQGYYKTTSDITEPLLHPDLEHTVYGATDCTTPQTFPVPSSNFLGWKVWNPIIASCLLAGHTLSYFQLLPIFLQTPLDPTVPPRYLLGIGGLSLTISTTGHIMGFAGVINLFIQSLLFPLISTLFPLSSIFLFVTIIHPVAYFLLPYIAFIPQTASVWRMVALYVWIASRTVCSVFAFPLLLVFVRRATPDGEVLGRVNGLVASSQAGFRTFAPAIAGWLQGVGEEKHFSALAWWGAGCVALIGAIQGVFVVRGFGKDELR